MRRWLVVLGVLVALLGAAFAVAVLNLNSWLNDNRDWIADQAREATGRDLSFEEVGVSVLDGLGARVGGLRIGEDPTYAEEDFLTVDEAIVQVRILPALQGRVEVDRIVLKSPQIHVIRDARGFNFSTMAQGAPADAAAEPPATAPPVDGATPAPTQEPSAIPLAVALFDLRDARVRFEDRTTKPVRDTTIADLDVELRDVALDSPVGLSVQATILGADAQNLSLEGTVGPVEGAGPEGPAFDLSIDLGPLVLDELRTVPGVGASIPADLAAPDPVGLSMKAVGTSASATVELRTDVSDAALRLGDTFRKPAGTALRLDTKIQYAGEQGRIEKLAMALAGLEITGTGSVGLGESGRYDMQLASNRAPVGGWGELLPALAGPELSGTVELDMRARGPVSGGRPALDGTLALSEVAARMEGSPYEVSGLSTTVTFSGQKATIPETRFQLGGSPVVVALTLDGFEDPSVDLSLSSPELRAASLGLAGEGVQAVEMLRGLAVKGDADKVLSKPNADLAVRIDDGVFRDLAFEELVMDLDVAGNVASLKPLSLKAYGGTFRGGARYDTREQDRPRFRTDAKIDGMDLDALLASQMPAAQGRIRGTLKTDIELNGEGAEWPTIQNTLKGDGQLMVEDGALLGINLADEILAGVTGIGGLSTLVPERIRTKYPEVFGVDDTNFDQLSGTVTIRDGRAVTDDLVIAARDYTLRGEGTYELRNHADFTASLILSEALTQDILRSVKEARFLTNEKGRIVIPAKIEGAAPDLSPKPDTGYIAKALGRAAVQTGLDAIFGKKKPKKEGDAAAANGAAAGAAAEEPAEDPTRELLQKGLESLFNR